VKADDDVRRRRILDLIAKGLLPGARATRFNVTPSSGIATCMVCGALFAGGELEYEALIDHTTVAPLHSECLRAWLREAGKG
jgi:hypothetical protein